MWRSQVRRPDLRVALLAGSLLVAVGAAAGPSGYQKLHEVVLPSVTGWDYLAIDPESRRLFISDNAAILVVDIDTLATIGAAPRDLSLHSVGMLHGVALAPPLHRGFISRELPPSVMAFDLESRTAAGTAPTDPGTDAILYEPVTAQVYTFNGKVRAVHDATVIDAETMRVSGRLALPGRPEAAVADGHGRVYVNIASRSELGVIDARSRRLTALWPLAPCVDPSALAMDAVRQVLFAACDNQIIVSVDARSGAVLGSVRSGDGTDALAFDGVTDTVFASNGEGTLTVAHEESSGQLKLVDTVPTAPNARTLALDPKTHRVFLLAGKFGPPGRRTAENPHGYPVAKAGSVRLLVMGPR